MLYSAQVFSGGFGLYSSIFFFSEAELEDNALKQKRLCVVMNVVSGLDPMLAAKTQL